MTRQDDMTGYLQQGGPLCAGPAPPKPCARCGRTIPNPWRRTRYCASCAHEIKLERAAEHLRSKP